MIKQQTLVVVGSALVGLTVVAGFAIWWSFILVAFGSAFYLARREPSRRVVLVSGLAPAGAWLMSAFARDAFENFRISHKLAGLLQIHFSIAVYGALFLMIAIPSCLAAYSGCQTSKSLR